MRRDRTTAQLHDAKTAADRANADIFAELRTSQAHNLRLEAFINQCLRPTAPAPPPPAPPPYAAAAPPHPADAYPCSAPPPPPAPGAPLGPADLRLHLQAAHTAPAPPGYAAAPPPLYALPAPAQPHHWRPPDRRDRGGYDHSRRDYRSGASDGDHRRSSASRSSVDSMDYHRRRGSEQTRSPARPPQPTSTHARRSGSPRIRTTEGSARRDRSPPRRGSSSLRAPATDDGPPGGAPGNDNPPADAPSRPGPAPSSRPPHKPGARQARMPATTTPGPHPGGSSRHTTCAPGDPASAAQPTGGRTVVINPGASWPAAPAATASATPGSSRLATAQAGLQQLLRANGISLPAPPGDATAPDPNLPPPQHASPGRAGDAARAPSPPSATKSLLGQNWQSDSGGDEPAPAPAGSAPPAPAPATEPHAKRALSLHQAVGTSGQRIKAVPSRASAPCWDNTPGDVPHRRRRHAARRGSHSPHASDTASSSPPPLRAGDGTDHFDPDCRRTTPSPLPYREPAAGPANAAPAPAPTTIRLTWPQPDPAST